MVWINFWGLLGDFLYIYSCPLSSWFCKTRQNFTTDTITWVWLCPHSQDKWGRRVILKCQYGTRVIQLSIVRRVIPLLLPFTMDRWNDDKVRWMALTCYSGIVVWAWWQLYCSVSLMTGGETAMMWNYFDRLCDWSTFFATSTSGGNVCDARWLLSTILRGDSYLYDFPGQRFDGFATVALIGNFTHAGPV